LTAGKDYAGASGVVTNDMQNSSQITTTHISNLSVFSKLDDLWALAIHLIVKAPKANFMQEMQ